MGHTALLWRAALQSLTWLALSPFKSILGSFFLIHTYFVVENSGEAKILNFSRPGSLRDATLACIRMGCEGGNPDIKWLRL